MEKKRILIADDEPDFLQMVKMRLETNGYEIITASDGKEVLDKIKADKPDAVFLDILMPQLDGLKVLREIRKRDKKLPVFMITAFSNEERFELANKLNASGFIIKTSDLSKEIKNITAVLDIASKYKGK
ncbi:MAG: response regulator [Candidatus Omnitrophota bacterium]|nr:response regulator [Candidatus Omnitrophota bacterium]